MRGSASVREGHTGRLILGAKRDVCDVAEWNGSGAEGALRASTQQFNCEV